MSVINVLIWKEFKTFLREKKILVTLCIITAAAVVFSFFPISSAASIAETGGTQLLRVAAIVCMYAFYTLPWETFYLERYNRTLVSLLAGPVSVRSLFAAKELGCAMIMAVMNTLAVCAAIVLQLVRGQATVTALQLVAVLLVVPIWGYVLMQLMSLAVVLFGNAVIILRYLMPALIVAFIGLSTGSRGVSLANGWMIAIAGIAGIFAALLINWLSGRMSVERLLRFV